MSTSEELEFCEDFVGVGEGVAVVTPTLPEPPPVCVPEVGRSVVCPPTVATLLGGLVAAVSPKFQLDQSTCWLSVGWGVGVLVTSGVGVMTVSKFCPSVLTVKPLSFPTTRSGSI